VKQKQGPALIGGILFLPAAGTKALSLNVANGMRHKRVMQRCCPKLPGPDNNFLFAIPVYSIFVASIF
jgi:hypothetical protein